MPRSGKAGPGGSLRLRAALCAGAVLLAGGLTPALAHEHFYDVALTGGGSNPSPATGVALVTLDLDLITARFEVSFAGLVGNSLEVQLLCCSAVPASGTALSALASPSPAGFPVGVHSGSFDITYDLTEAATYNPFFITASGGMVVDALNALINGAEAGTVYLSIVSSAYPGGEIRGLLVEQVPETATYALMLAGLAAVGWVARKRSSL
jgi:hypothetical protein